MNLRLNRNTGEWDFELLKEFDSTFLLNIGFDNKDLSDIWNDVLGIEDDNFDVDAKINEVKVPIAQPGDIWQMDNHRLVCGDSQLKETISAAANNHLIDMLYFDPVYEIGLDYNKGIGGKSNYGGNTNDNKGVENYRSFLTSCISNSLQFCKKDAHVFCYCDQLKTGLIQEVYRELGIESKRVCLWIKNGFNPTPKIAFNKGYEPCVYGTIGTPPLYNQSNLNEILNKEIGSGNSTVDDIIDLFDIWIAKREAMNSYQHPTQTPV